jgi:hypothetical protein
MKLFGITSDETFKEYVETDFQVEYQEAILEDWLEKNPDSIIEDGSLLIVGRQVTTNLGGFVDLLAVDKQGDTAVVELKRGRTPRETLAQALEYASFVEHLDYEQLEDIIRTYMGDEFASLAQHHRDYFGLAPDEAVVFNRDQRIVIVGQRVSPEIRQTSMFLRQKGVRVTCVEFTLFETEEGRRLLSSDVVVGREPPRLSRVSSSSLPVVSEEQFIDSLDEYGKPVFDRLLEFARTDGLAVHWGTKGFSLNVDLDGTHVAVCYGYPPDCMYGQSVYTALVGRGGLLSKIDASEDVAQVLLSVARETGLFRPAGRELKCAIDRVFAEQEIDLLVSWCEKIVSTIRTYGLRE